MRILCAYLWECRPRWGFPGGLPLQTELCSCSFREKNRVPTTLLLFMSSPRVVERLWAGTSLARGSPWEDPRLALLPFPLHGPQGTSVTLQLTDASRVSTAPARLRASVHGRRTGASLQPGWGMGWGRQVLLRALPKDNQQWGWLLLFCFYVSKV